MTGATGFVGANLVRRLLADGHDVHMVMRTSGWRIRGLTESVNTIHTSELYDSVLRVKPEWVFNLAATGVLRWQDSMRSMVYANIRLVQTLTSACADADSVQAFVHAGTSLEYGFKDHPTSESDSLAPTNDYAITKAVASRYCQEVALRHDLPISILRLYSVYGFYEDSSRLIPTLIRHGLNGKLPPLANPDNARDFVHVQDVCDALIRAAEFAGTGEVFNIGTGAQTTLAEAVGVARDLMGIQDVAAWNTSENRIWDTSVWVADSTKARTLLNWQPRYTFRDGFQATIDWMKANRNLYPMWEIAA